MWKALIIDDESHAIEALKWELQENCPEVEIVATTQKPLDAIKLIYTHNPDLLFLDIEMPRLNGFELLETLPPNKCKIIFTTAYDEFAIKAIKVSAFDYLLKPIDSDELRLAINKFIEQKTQDEHVPLQEIITSISGQQKIEKIAVSSNNGTDFIDQDDIYFCESSGNYTYLHLENEKILVSKTLKHIEQQLNPHIFLRTHHSFVVNLNYVVKYLKGEGGEVVLKNKVHVKVSRSRKENVLMQLNIAPAK